MEWGVSQFYRREASLVRKGMCQWQLLQNWLTVRQSKAVIGYLVAAHLDRPPIKCSRLRSTLRLYWGIANVDNCFRRPTSVRNWRVRSLVLQPFNGHCLILYCANLLHVEPPPGMKLEDGYTHGCSIIAIGNPWKWPLYQLKKEFDPDETMPLVVASGQGQLNVERWSELGIGIYQDTTYFGISPCPDNYAVFPLESATELPLRGRRWKVLLNLLAGSENGNSANKKEMMQELQMFDPGNYSPLDESEVAEHSGRLTLARTLNSELTKKIGDLACKLRACVDCPDKEGSTAVLSAADTPTCIQSLFMVRPLVRGPDGKLHFGKE